MHSEGIYVLLQDALFFYMKPYESNCMVLGAV